MSDIMRPIPYEELLHLALTEARERGSIFGVSKTVRFAGGGKFGIFGKWIESPFGPAAGPNTQLAQNIVAAYVAGSRFFELKTVQKMDGRELAACVAKPCIAAGDEGYNCEWSTELEVGQAYEEYVKAFFLCRILARELDLGDPDGFVFNMSVGYDLEGIKTEKIDRYIEGMKDASGEAIYAACKAASLKAVESGLLRKADAAFIEAFPVCLSDSITESTLHGCPPDEIERIAGYLIAEKGLHTYIKCNPTLLGYDFARRTLDGLGFDYIAFDDHHFLEDLQWEDAVPMFKRLTALAAERDVEFGVKLSNTFPVDVKAGELPSEEMYMSGRALYPLTIELSARIAREFDGKLRISYSGGADFFNIRDIFDAGIWPVTMATTILKPGGYERLYQIAGLFTEAPSCSFERVDPEKTAALAASARKEARYRKSVKPLPDRKNGRALPLLDCFSAPCREGCPIGQDIPAYLRAVEEGRAADALRIILQRNALPFTTGTICPHTCVDRCMRNHYEEGLHIREMKLLAAKQGFAEVLESLKAEKADTRTDRKAAVVGGGPAGIAAASFLSRAGIPVTVFEKRDSLGGVPRYVIPSFRIGAEAIDADIELARASGAEFVTGREITSIEALRAEGYTDIVLAGGAWAHGRPALSYGEAMDALDFLLAAKEAPGSLKLGEDVAVIGGGNTAMDVARAAKRLDGVKHVRLVYRRTKRYMPADEEELELALKDGVEFAELLAPLGVKDGLLTCEVCVLGERDESGRRSPQPTGEKLSLKADTVIAAVGEQIDSSLLAAAGAAIDEKGRPVVDGCCQSSLPGVYVIGDMRQGPQTVVKAIADAQRAAAAIYAGAKGCTAEEAETALFGAFAGENEEKEAGSCLAKRGKLAFAPSEGPDARCLGCATVCEVCVEVCPNRANVAIDVPGMEKPQILHIDRMCNECGNCAVFCPYAGKPYKDKFTLFACEEDFADSSNDGFLLAEDLHAVRVRLGGRTACYDALDSASGLYEPVRQLILAAAKREAGD